MSHEIDQTRSEIGAFYGRQPGWHGLGTVVGDGLNLEEAMKTSLTDYIVSRRPAGMMTPDGVFVPVDDKVVTFREDTGAPLGVVGKDYEIVQNLEAFGFLEELVGAFGYVWESMGALYGGRQTFAVLKVPNGDTNVNGVDEILPYVFVRTSHDGSTKITSKATFIRPVCANTVRAALSSGIGDEISIRHTKNARDRMAEAVRHDEHFTKYKAAFLAESNKLAQTTMSDSEFEKFLSDLWPEPEKTTDEGKPSKAHTRWENRNDELKRLWKSPTQENVAGTLWAADQTVTEYFDWVQPIRKTESRSALTEDFIRGLRSLEGDTDTHKTKAHKLLLQRA